MRIAAKVRRCAAIVAALACAVSTAIAQPASIVATGQVLDAQAGFVFFTTGDGFRIDPNAPILDYKTKLPTSLKIRPRMFARATFNPANGHITQLELSSLAVPPEGDLNSVRRFAVAASPQKPNPDLAPPTPGTTRTGTLLSALSREPLSGKPVLVTFTVQVPPSTRFSDPVYISTDLSGWNPQAVRMDRIDALHYRVVRRLSSGTVFYYRYTRGSQATAERGENGMEGAPRHLEILNLDVKDKDDVVYHWGDEQLNGQAGSPLAVPTPYNPNPFGNLPPNPHRPQPTPPH
ncbi:MAG: hypothetical protein JO233_04395 [Candidatus Eremiobacteraeota bacterium]|nr:hypothetical protein [Candidatus Eremiobacteraeota bacterium]